MAFVSKQSVYEKYFHQKIAVAKRDIPCRDGTLTVGTVVKFIKANWTSQSYYDAIVEVSDGSKVHKTSISSVYMESESDAHFYWFVDEEAELLSKVTEEGVRYYKEKLKSISCSPFCVLDEIHRETNSESKSQNFETFFKVNSCM